ncbi:MAG: hypothetical protein DRO73_06535 [Candidatus Thorarchaeota archaeon]|nr:MAG: hypothetical protein DRO73_06535 [Candidatus Thorarchaeota archaeon]
MPLMRTSSSSFPATPDLTSEIPYVVRVEFAHLSRPPRSSLVSRPIACYKCNGFVTDIDQILTDEKIGRYFICQFCGTLNVVEGSPTVVDNDTDISMEVAPTDGVVAAETVMPSGKSFLAVIDVSGSMDGVNIAAVKRSIATSIDSLAANAPTTLFGLIEFSSEVGFRNLDSGDFIALPPDTYASLEQIKSATEDLLEQIRLVPVGEKASDIKRHIQSLQVGGSTALGPALGMAYSLTRHREIGRVVLLTDGLANNGIGSFEGFLVTPPKKYYHDLGKWFLETGTVVDIVGIASHSGLELKTLGVLADLTGGTMYYVTPNELDFSMSEIAGERLLARNVEVRILTPPGVKIRDASGLSRLAVEELKASRTTRLAAVAERDEIHIELSPESTIEAQEIPIQIQVEYTDDEGARHVRVMTKRFRVARTPEELLKTLDPEVGATFVTQKAGEESFEGDVERGRLRISEFRASLKKQAAIAPSPVKARIEEVESVLAEEEAEMVRLQERAASEGMAEAAAQDMFSAAALQQKRRTSGEMFKKKKKR